MSRCTIRYHADDSQLQKLFRDRLEMIDGKWTNEFYFYCYPDEVSSLVVGYTNIIRINDRQLDLFIHEIETRCGRHISDKSYKGDDRLFDPVPRQVVWNEQMDNTYDWGVIVTGEITNCPEGPFEL